MISRSQKEAMLLSVQEKLQDADAVLLTQFGGLDVAGLTSLRCGLRAVGGGFSVVKNRIFLKALQSPEYGEYGVLSEFFKGPVGVVYLKGDVGAGAKVINAYLEEEEKFQISAGFFDGSLLTPEDVKAIAELPSKEVLVGKVLSSLVGLHRNLLGVLSGNARELVGVLGAIKDKKSESS